MFSPPAPTEVSADTGRGHESAGATPAGSATNAHPALPRAARRFATRCHARQRRDSDGAQFIEHPLEVARLLRDAGCSDVVIAAGLLHDIIEDTSVSGPELTACFGADVAGLVQAVSQDVSIESYRQRKQALRDQVRDAGRDAAVLFAADKISKVRELPDLVRRDQANGTTASHESHSADGFAHDLEMRLEHYRESLGMLRGVAADHALVTCLANELDRYPVNGPRRAIGDDPYPTDDVGA